ncbi:alpha/beta fold hydrolase [Altererythrobacter aerius]|uniref:Proline iminopeptidase n=1 Tax=Tsuneonella aeria TaxID=1837929 RepID=A0A6I4TD72_9SPHN|nr:alpha/beta fold hydrolase [Tsuneonella aeria]MXO74734.1 alpha/beta fold hydrolase [Tsuneonella aeria]
MFLATLAAAAAAAFQPAPCGLKDVPPDYERKHAVECGWVTVPRDHAEPAAKSIRLWTARIRGTGPEPRGEPVLFINGGPGIATVDSMLPYLEESKASALLREGRDLILFDQRGSGRSEEALCPDLASDLNAIALQGLGPAAQSGRERAAFAACRASLDAAGIDPGAYSTRATVHDMEAIRRAYGIERWNLAGISYGTLVALDAMRTTPASIRSVVLNSPYPPNSAAWAEQLTTVGAGFAAIDRECSAQPACRGRFGAVGAKLDETLARLEKTPIADGEKRITGRQFMRALWPLAVRSVTVKYVPLAIDRAHAGDDALVKKIVAAFGGGDSFGDYSPAQAHAIMCPESGRTADWFARARERFPVIAGEDPDDNWDTLCAAFRPGFVDPAFFAPVASDIPTLVYFGTFDPATPEIDAYQTVRLLSRATLVEVRGASHGPMVMDDCTLGIARTFLAAPERAVDRSCLAARPPIAFATDGLDALLAGTE